MKVKWKYLIVCLIVVFATAFLGSLFTSADTDWYDSIKPSITPPNYVFPIVWNILFLLISVSLYLAWVNSEHKQKKKISLAFGINLFLNVLWSILFFGLQNPFLAFLDLILLFLSIIIIIRINYRINRISAYLLLPYLLWVGFAGVLNYLIIST